MIQAAVFTTALALVALAVFIPVYGWGLISMARDGDWLWVAVQPIMWIWVTVSVVRERRRKARTLTRQPGTFG